MRKVILFALAGALAADAPMGRTTDWWALGGDGLRDGWEKSEQRFTKEEVKDFRLLWQHKMDGPPKTAGPILPPVVLGNLIGYRGFKELAFVASGDNAVVAIDADLDRVYWQRQFETAKPKHGCTARLTAAPALPGPIVFRTGSAVKRRNVRPVFVLTGDGLLRQLNQSDGADLEKPMPFIPAGVAAGPLNVSGDIVYTTTAAGCGHEAAVWSIDSADPEAQAKSLKLGADIVGMGGIVIDSQDRLLVATGDGPLDPANGKYGGALASVSKDLSVTQYFILPQGPTKTRSIMNRTAPTEFTYKGADFVVTAAPDGCLYILKSADVGGVDHHLYLSKSIVLPAMDGEKTHGIGGALATWRDVDGTCYVLAPIWGPLSAEMKAAFPDAQAPNGSLVVFTVVDGKDNAPTLKPAWVTENLARPAPPVIAKGVVFTLSNGKLPHQKAPAMLLAFDGASGKRLYSSGDQVQTAANGSGLTIANGRIYFATADRTLDVFGKYLEP